MKKLRIGTMVGAETALDVIPQILPYGFECFALNFGASTKGMDLPELAKEVKGLLDGKDVVISVVSAYGNPLDNTDEARETVASLERVIDNAHHFGADVVTGFAGRVVGKPIDASIPRFKEVFGPLAKRAADKGVRIAFENCDMGGDWQTGGWNIAHDPTAWEMMFDAVPMDNLGLEWEPCHQMVKLIDPIPQLRKWVHRVFHLHGKDATVGWDVIREYGIKGPKEFAWHRTPGFGDSNWEDIITILRQGGYEGTIDIEGWHDPVYRGELEMMGQVHALNYLKRCRGGEIVPNPPW
jgi:sugar phosphate isomerase/epimerase